MSAYELIDQYQVQNDDALSSMTAYRILDMLVEAGLVHKLTTINQYLCCSHLLCEHDHQAPEFLICVRCHRVKEVGISNKLVSELKSSIEKTGFSLAKQQLELHGVCADCAEE